MDKNIELGKIVNTHGLKGEMKIQPWCNDIELFDTLEKVFIDDIEYNIVSSRVHKDNVLVILDGINNINDAEKLKNKVITVSRDILTLSQGEYFICDILGCTVEKENNKVLGVVDDVIQTGSNDVYILKNLDDKQILIPAIKEVIKNIDIENKKITVKLLKGLIDDED